MIINWHLVIESLPFLLQGAVVSLQIAFLSCILGLVLGTILGISLEYGESPIIRWPILFFITLIRGTPMLIQIYIAYYILPQLGIIIPDFWAATCAIGINSSAYVCTIIRSGIASVGSGQIEAAQVLGFTWLQSVQLIILPQAVRIILPALINEFITLIKDSALASVIGVVELSKEGSIIRSRTYDSITIFPLVALLYLVMTTTTTIIMHFVEKKLNRHVKN